MQISSPFLPAAVLLYAVIILAIPTGFYLTYMAFAKQIDWDAPYREDEEAEETKDDDTTSDES